jgi:osmotically-inducible protein OsmY
MIRSVLMPSVQERTADSSEESTSRGNSTGTLLIGLVAGAALAFLFDPARGATRRAVLRDKLASALRSTRRDVNAKALDLKQRGQGLIAETRNRMNDENVGDEQLVARVRAALGHHVDRVRPIEVVADGDRVILRGSIDAADIETAVATARTVRGVAEVENQLEPYSGETNVRA